MLIGSLAFSQNVGINTEQPTNTLHISSSANPLRMEGLQDIQETDGEYSILTSTSTGVVKKLGNSQMKEVLISPSRAQGRPSILGSSIVNNDFVKLNFAVGLSGEDSSNYNTSTGEYTVPKDGLYHIESGVTFNVLKGDTNHPITFDGRFIRLIIGIVVENTALNTSYRVGTVSQPIFRGAYIPEGSSSVLSGKDIAAYYFLPSGTVWLKKGERVSIQYIIYGGISPLTTSDSGTASPDRAAINMHQAYLKIFRIL